MTKFLFSISLSLDNILLIFNGIWASEKCKYNYHRIYPILYGNCLRSHYVAATANYREFRVMNSRRKWFVTKFKSNTIDSLCEKPVAGEMKHNYKRMHKINITGLSCVRSKNKRQQVKIFINIGTRHDTLDLLLFPHRLRLVKNNFYRFVGLNGTFTGLCSGLKGLSAMKNAEINPAKCKCGTNVSL